MKILIFMLSLVFVFTFVGCSTEIKQEAISEAEMINLVNHYGREETDEVVSITSDALIIEKNEELMSKYSLPDDKFFVAIAPYVENTHPCEIHYLTECEAEMPNQEFKLIIIDKQGNVRTETLTSTNKGFINLWLDKNNEYEIKITHELGTSELHVFTQKNSKTCITNAKLQ